VDASFGYLKRKEVPAFEGAAEQPIKGPVVKEVSGPEPESIEIGFRLPGIHSRDYLLLTVFNRLLYNGRAGVIDLNLNQSQMVRDGYSSVWGLNDYAIHFLGASPREGQSLSEVQKLLLDQVEAMKQGEFFGEQDIDAVINNMEISQVKRYESNSGRVYHMLSSFVEKAKWIEKVGFFQELRKITKEEIVAFANANYSGNCVIGKKLTGEKDQVSKVMKPPITAVEVNREASSPFLDEIKNRPNSKISPLFLDYSRDIQILDGPAPLHYVRNAENSLFTMYYILDMGETHDKLLPIAIRYLKYLGTSEMTSEKIQKEFYQLGSSFDIFTDERQVYVYTRGLDRNFEATLKLFEDVLKNCVANETALQNLIADILKERSDAKLTNWNITWAMQEYGTYGARNPYNDILSEAELKKIESGQLIRRIQELTSYKHRVLYYGPMESAQLSEHIRTYHKIPDQLNNIPDVVPYEFVERTGKKVYFVNYDMVQAEIFWVANSTSWNPEMLPVIELFNEYYGGSMSSVVFQTIRESKALAYSTYSEFSSPELPAEPFTVIAYVGTQADKMTDAINGMNELLNQMPESAKLLSGSKDAIRNRIDSERIARTGILFNYEEAMKMKLNKDIREDIYNQVNGLSFEQVKSFHEKYIAGENYTLLVIGSREQVNLDELKKFGDVEELTLETLFGY